MVSSIPLGRNASNIAFLSPGMVSLSSRPNTDVGPSMAGGSGPENSCTVSTEPSQTYPYFGTEASHQQARRIRLAIRWTS
jgi:hypothetical protein